MKIVVLDGYTANPGDLDWSVLESIAELHVYERTSPSQIIERAKDAEVILTNKVPIGKDLMDILTRLKYIGVLATGYSIIDLDYAKILGIRVTNIPDYSTESVAQHSIALILNRMNAVFLHAESVRRGDWTKAPDFSYRLGPIEEIKGKTIGILGFGNIGHRVAELAKAFGMRVIVSRHPDASTPRRYQGDSGFELADFEDLAESCDILSLHCPLTPATKKIINREWLSRARGLFLVNTARGGLVDEDALLDALNEGRVSYYCADVYEPEPPSRQTALLRHERADFTPHLAWASTQARERLVHIAAENIRSYLEGGSLNTLV